jgi:hypothetical protein
MRHIRLGWLACTAALGLVAPICAQHNAEFYNNGTTVSNSTTISIWGDMHHMGGTLSNTGTVQVQGNLYSNTSFQQRGNGTVLIQNADVNTTERQFIQGSYAVRGGQSQIGVDDGSFYDLVLANSQGIVWLNGTGNVADVRNSVDFRNGAGIYNRIITHNPTALPANGSGYSAVFGIMNTTAGLTGMPDNTVNVNGNMSAVDNAYVQGKLRRAIAAAGGQYGFVLGLEPAGAGMARGVQYTRIDFGANNYDVVTGYYQQGSDNTIAGSPVECGYNINYFGGIDHGEWVFDDIGAGVGTYQMWVWPQDDNFPPANVWFITKDNAISGLTNDCGPSPVALDRNNFNGFSEFGVASGTVVFPIELLDLSARGIDNSFIRVNWLTGSESGSSHYDVERSEDGVNFQYIGTKPAAGNASTTSTYHFDDLQVLPGVLYHYRLKQVDLDGAFQHTHSVSAMLDPAMAEFNFDVWPNPVGDGELQVLLDVPTAQYATMKIYDGIGKLVFDQKFELLVGPNLFSLPTDQIADGTYHLSVDGKDFHVGRKLLKIKH